MLGFVTTVVDPEQHVRRPSNWKQDLLGIAQTTPWSPEAAPGPQSSSARSGGVSIRRHAQGDGRAARPLGERHRHGFGSSACSVRRTAA
jgi:hypothetical protein